MLDIFFFAELVWCSFLIGIRGLNQAMIYTAALFTTGYVSQTLSKWIADTFVAPPSPVFKWVESHISNRAEAVSALAGMIPPEPASTMASSHVQWITVHIVRTLVFLFITAAVFVLFHVVSKLTDALWDRPERQFGKTPAIFSPLLAIASGAYLVVLTGVFIGNLAWLQDFSGLSAPAAHSLGLHWIAYVLNAVQRYGW
ncbi:hypothetical protein LLE49_13310 [Alicyclobacillus tolerans]|uniref:hypothetical protein n=1 Tax=Alicyclobacillus tolerans TaxID=90970 RepID=UPI001F29F330|nr:hypothetical protein [Alicyclobacillus tolerans]MCF8565697.1 hypothetical protein [Alicyclobacillus tolerans]